MHLPQRLRLPHNIPLWVDPQKSVYFITINCQERGINQLARPEVAIPLLDSVVFRNEKSIWFARVFLVMPDHVHALLSFPPSENTVQKTMSRWKRWTTWRLKIKWQRDFFEHRRRCGGCYSCRTRKAKVALYVLGNFGLSKSDR
jgi:REP element-mobilizing transposase RayT